MSADATRVGARRPIETDDLFRLRWLSEPRLAPSGEWAAVTVTSLDRKLDRVVSQVAWVAADVEGDGPLQPERGPVGQDHDPRWAPDGRRLAFVSDRSGGPQVWLTDIVERTSRQLTDLATGASGPSWAPDGGSVAFVSPEAVPAVQGPFTVAPFRWKIDGVGVVAGPTMRHIWVIPTGGGEAWQLTHGDWDDDLPRFSPDGGTVAFRSNRTDERRTSTTAELWLVSATGGEARCLVPALGAIRMHAWSPDGHWIAYVGHRQAEAQGVNQDVWLVEVATGAARNLTSPLDRPMGQWVRSDPPGMFLPPDLAWTPAGDAIHVVYADGGTSRVARVSLDGVVETVVAGPVGWFSFGVAPVGGQIAALGSTADDPGELLILPPGGEPRVITNVAREWRAGIEFGPTERFEFDAPDGQRLEAWIQHPAGRPATEQLPLVLHIHGGPHWPIGVRFGFEFRRLAEQGYRVLFMNPRGAAGYGDAYAQANVGDWGGIDARDLLAAVDAACARPDMDADRVAVTGESYGGFMTNWLIATTNRFRAGVAQNGISDLRSEYLMTSDPIGTEWDLGGPPWERPERYLRLSPLTLVEQIRTPLLLIHSEADQNCPISQSEQLYTALRLLGREVEFLRLPGEGHLVNLTGRPSSRLARIEATDRFLAHHLRR